MYVRSIRNNNSAPSVCRDKALKHLSKGNNMNILINQMSEMIEEVGVSVKETEFERGYREGLRVSVHMLELYKKIKEEE